jgi:ATP-dependent Clp protease ATP-binding subunit ClpB
LLRLNKLLAERKIAVTLTEAARELLAEKGYDPAYGARPLKRVIQKSIQDSLAEEILAGRVKDGDSVDVSVNDAKFTFNGVVVGADAKPPAVKTLH